MLYLIRWGWEDLPMAPSLHNFPLYIKNFPKESHEEIVAAYPCLEKNALETELDVLYGREDLIGKKYRIPKHCEFAEICFSTLKRIKTFLCSYMVNEKLTGLAMVSTEN